MDKISISELSIDHVKVSAVCNVRNLKTAINKTCQSGLYNLHDNGRIERWLNRKKKPIVRAIAMPRIHYCNCLLYDVAATISNGCKTRQSDWCAHCQDMNTSHRHLYVFTGCRLSLESSAFMDTLLII